MKPELNAHAVILRDEQGRPPPPPRESRFTRWRARYRNRELWFQREHVMRIEFNDHVTFAVFWLAVFAMICVVALLAFRYQQGQDRAFVDGGYCQQAVSVQTTNNAGNQQMVSHVLWVKCELLKK